MSQSLYGFLSLFFLPPMTIPRGFALVLALVFLLGGPAAASGHYYEHRGLCGLAAVGIRLFGYAEVVEIGVGFGAPRSEVVGFLSWCSSRLGVGDGGGGSGGACAPAQELCRFDTECTATCEGSTLWKRGCQPVYEGACIVRRECKKTFDTNCAAQSTTAASYTFPYTCNPSAPACVKDTAAIRAKLAELEQQRDKLKSDLATLEAENQRLATLQKKAASACLSGASDVTSKLIVDTALLASGFKAEAEVAGAINRFYGVVVADTTGKVVDEAVKAGQKYGALPGSPPTDTQQEFWVNMCLLEKSIRESDMPLWNRQFLDVKAKADALIPDIQALNSAL